MKQRVPISAIMAKELIKVSTTEKISLVYQFFQEHPIRHIPVTEGEKLVGIISKNDIRKIPYAFTGVNEEVVPAIFDNYELADMMTKNPISIAPTSTIKEAVEILSNESFHSLPVVDDGNLVGIVTSTDMLKYLLKQY